MYDLREREIVRRLVPVEPGSIVLDVCSGPGRWVIEYGSRGAEIVALDISIEMLQSNRTKNGYNYDVHYVLADAEHLPFATEAFDIVSCFDAFPHFPNPDQSLSEMSRVAKPNSMVVVEPSNVLSAIGLTLGVVRALARILKWLTGKMSPIWATSWTNWQMVTTSQRLIAEAGLNPLYMRGVGVMLPPSVKSLHFLYRLERSMENRVWFNWLGSRIVFICLRSAKDSSQK